MACGKRTYRSQLAAISAALHCSRKRGTPLRFYPCEHCKGFHLTKQERR